LSFETAADWFHQTTGSFRKIHLIPDPGAGGRGDHGQAGLEQGRRPDPRYIRGGSEQSTDPPPQLHLRNRLVLPTNHEQLLVLFRGDLPE